MKLTNKLPLFCGLILLLAPPAFGMSCHEALTGQDISVSHEVSGYRSESGPAKEFVEAFNSIRNSNGEIVLPGGVKLGKKLGEVVHSEVYETTAGEVIKISKSPNSSIAIDTENKVTQDLEKNYEEFGILTQPILEAGPSGSYLKKALIGSDLMAGNILLKQDLSDIQLRKLEETWQGIRRYATERDIHLDFTSDNIYWNGSDWVIFDAGPRTGSRKTKYTTGPQSFDEFLFIWNNNFLAKARHQQVEKFLDSSMADSEVPGFISSYFPETTYLTGLYERERNKTASVSFGDLPSEIMFGDKHLEFDRTLNAIVFLKWVREGQLDKIIENQASPQLTQAQLGEIKELILRTLKNQEDWDAMLTYMAIHDAAKTSDIADNVRERLNSSTEDHDLLLIEALQGFSGFAPSFERLPSKQKAKIIAAMKADFNMGQFNQGENLPANLDGLRSLDGESTDFYLVHVLADIAGVLGHISSNGAKLMNANTYNGFSHGIRALGGIKTEESLTDIYDNLLLSHANKVGFEIKTVEDRALMRIGVLLDVQEPLEMVQIDEAFNSLDAGLQKRLVEELNKTGIEDSGILIYYFPAILKSLKGSQGIEFAISKGLPVIDQIFQKTREHITFDTGVFTVHITELKDLVAKDPEAIDLPFEIDLNNRFEATLRVLENGEN